MSRRKGIAIAFANSGLKGILSQISGRLLGISRYLRSASSIDFKHSNLIPAKTIEEFISKLQPALSPNEISRSLSKAKKIVNTLSNKEFYIMPAPKNWNAGKDLQYILTTLVLLLKPDVVVETGTANGASTAAIAAGLKYNRMGQLISFDIANLEPVLISKDLRHWVKLVITNGTSEELIHEIKKIKTERKSIFLHDSDHSYLGQYSDYKVAKENGFDILLSDDIDTSLAFCDFAGNKGVVYYDAPKFIGGVRIKEL